jgi:16S rRNA (cytosine1402-N4)-methyltransferase
MSNYHESVLVKESLDFLLTDFSGTYVDATFGGGGHAREILTRLHHDAVLIAFDVDENSYQIASEMSLSDKRLRFFRENFSEIDNVFRKERLGPANGFLFDLGVSSYQLDDEPGFSYRRDDKLDMRMDKRLSFSAYDVLNTYNADALAQVFKEYGDEPKAYRLAKAVVRTREKMSAPGHDHGLKTTLQFAAIVRRVCGESVKTLSRIFQAIRIEVNKELDSLSAGLDAAIHHTSRGGRIVVISYHSLEDKIVKEKFKFEAATCVCPPEAVVCSCGKLPTVRILTRKPVRPAQSEVTRNRRARSAKLRAVEKIL